MQLASLKSTVQTVLAQSNSLRTSSERQALYAHTCQILALLLEAPGEGGPGWSKAALFLLGGPSELPSEPRLETVRLRTSSRPMSRSVVEIALSVPPLAELEERLLAVLCLPELTLIESLPDMQQTLEAAIALGAPTYNRGDIAGCARIYLATALTLVNAQVSRGFPGQAKALDTLKKGVAEALALSDGDQRAWALRHTFDRILR